MTFTVKGGERRNGGREEESWCDLRKPRREGDVDPCDDQTSTANTQSKQITSRSLNVGMNEASPGTTADETF